MTALDWKIRGAFPYLKASPAGRVLLARNRVMDWRPGTVTGREALKGVADESADRSGRESGAGLANGGAKADVTPSSPAATPLSACGHRAETCKRGHPR